MYLARLADLALRQRPSPRSGCVLEQGAGVIQERENWGRLELPVIGWVYIRLGELLYERNELATGLGSSVAAGWNAPNSAATCGRCIAGYLIAGRLKLTEGDIEAAVELPGAGAPAG